MSQLPSWGIMLWAQTTLWSRGNHYSMHAWTGSSFSPQGRSRGIVSRRLQLTTRPTYSDYIQVSPVHLTTFSQFSVPVPVPAFRDFQLPVELSCMYVNPTHFCIRLKDIALVCIAHSTHSNVTLHAGQQREELLREWLSLALQPLLIPAHQPWPV